MRAKREDLYRIYIKAVFLNGKIVLDNYDLAYLFIRKNDIAYNLALELDFDCDPCTEPFDWIKIDENGFQFIGKSNDNIEYWTFVESKEYSITKIWVKSIKPKVKKKNSKGKYVFVVEKNTKGKNIAVKKMITMGETYGDKAQIISGLDAGAVLVTEGYQSLYNGQEIRTE